MRRLASLAVALTLCLGASAAGAETTVAVLGIEAAEAPINMANLLTLALLLAAPRVTKIIGQTGDDILRRLLGVILAALSIQFVADGIRQIVAG